MWKAFWRSKVKLLSSVQLMAERLLLLLSKRHNRLTNHCAHDSIRLTVLMFRTSWGVCVVRFSQRLILETSVVLVFNHRCIFIWVRTRTDKTTIIQGLLCIQIYGATGHPWTIMFGDEKVQLRTIDFEGNQTKDFVFCVSNCRCNRKRLSVTSRKCTGWHDS